MRMLNIILQIYNTTEFIFTVPALSTQLLISSYSNNSYNPSETNTVKVEIFALH